MIDTLPSEIEKLRQDLVSINRLKEGMNLKLKELVDQGIQDLKNRKNQFVQPQRQEPARREPG